MKVNPKTPKEKGKNAKPGTVQAAAIKATQAPASKRRVPFEVDITGAVKPGENVIAVRVDHTKITELFLGGIIRPVVLIERPRD